MSETVMCTIEKVLCEKDIAIEKHNSVASVWSEHNGMQRQIWNHAPHAVYINCRCHRLAIYFKHYWMISIVENSGLVAVGTMENILIQH